MQVSEILEMKKGIKAKLMAATSLLLVSAILLSLTTYAWFILSTAPEVTEMQTTAGANGSLEIALQRGDTAVSEIKNRVGDSSAVSSLKEANSTWGNVVDLSGNTYGLQGLSLLPARLNIDASGNVSKSSPLKMPLFGQDGRISELANLNSMRYNDETGKYVDGQDKHGVLVYADDESITNGTKDETRLDRQGLIDTTREQIVKLRADLRADLVQTMDSNQAGISAILCNTVNLDLGDLLPGSGNVYRYTKDDYGTITALLASFSSVQEKAARSVRHALLACVAADTTNYPVDTKTGVSEALSALYAKYLTLPMKSDGEADETVYSIATANKAKLSTGENSAQTSLIAAYDSVMQAAEATADVQRRVQAAQKSMIDNKRLTDLYKNENPTEADEVAFSQEISKSIQHLFDYRPESRAIYVTDETNEKNAPRTLWDEMQSGDKYYTYRTPKSEEPQTRFYMLKGSGLFSSLATIAGDYESNAIIGEDFNYYVTTQIRSTVSAPPAENAHVPYGHTFGFSPENNTGCLQSVYAATSGLKADGSVKYVITSAERVNAYGYAVDLAFRSSEIGNLFLQQDAKDRVTGAGSDTPEGRLPSTSTTQGNGSTVEFLLRRSGQEYFEGGNSAMDRAKNLLQCLRVAFLKDAGEWTVLGVAAVDAKSINLSEADNGQTVKATAKLTLYTTAVVDGVLTLKNAKTDQSITQLGVNTPTAITALVYLDGDEVQNAFLTPDQPFSLSGSINLQFATDAQNLKPMEYTDFIIPKKSEDGAEGNGQ